MDISIPTIVTRRALPLRLLPAPGKLGHPCMEWGGAIADYCFSNDAVVIPLAMRWEFGGAVVNVRRAFIAIIILFFATMLPSMAHAQQSAIAPPSVKGDLGANLITVTPELAEQRNLLLPFGW